MDPIDFEISAHRYALDPASSTPTLATPCSLLSSLAPHSILMSERACKKLFLRSLQFLLLPRRCRAERRARRSLAVRDLTNILVV